MEFENYAYVIYLSCYNLTYKLLIEQGNPAWVRKMDALVREFPDVFRIKRRTEVSKTYEMPKKYVYIGRPRELSPAQKENLEKMSDTKKVQS